VSGFTVNGSTRADPFGPVQPASGFTVNESTRADPFGPVQSVSGFKGATQP
jgi:hypothetical protein